MRTPRSANRLFRRKDSPFWWAEYTNTQGETVRDSTRCRDRGQAATWLATRELERVRGEAGVKVAVTVHLSRATAEYLAQQQPTWSKGWYSAVEGFVRNQILPHFSPTRIVSEISRADVQAFRAQQIGRPPRTSRCHKLPWALGQKGWACPTCGALPPPGKAVSDSTVNRLMAAMAAWGEWCLVEGRSYHLTNPWGGHDALDEDETPIPDLEEGQVAAIFAALDDPEGPLPSHGRRRSRAPWRAIFEFARETGLRRGQLAKIARSDIRQGILWVVSTKKRGKNKGRKLHAIPLSARALEILETLPTRTDGLVFGTIPDSRRAFARAAKAAGLERVWLHLFRHLFASRLSERGAGGAELRAAGGWSSDRMVKRYTHARMERLRELVGAPPAAYGPRTLTPENPAGDSE